MPCRQLKKLHVVNDLYYKNEKFCAIKVSFVFWALVLKYLLEDWEKRKQWCNRDSNWTKQLPSQGEGNKGKRLDYKNLGCQEEGSPGPGSVCRWVAAPLVRIQLRHNDNCIEILKEHGGHNLPVCWGENDRDSKPTESLPCPPALNLPPAPPIGRA